MYNEEPDCSKCLPELQDENVLIYEVYWRMAENIDPFKIMDLLGIKEELYCLDMVQYARSEVMRAKGTK